MVLVYDPEPENAPSSQDGQVESLAKELSRGATSAGTVVTERAMRAAFEQIAVPGVTLDGVRCVTALCEVVLRNQGGDTAPLLRAMVEHDVLQGVAESRPRSSLQRRHIEPAPSVHRRCSTSKEG